MNTKRSLLTSCISLLLCFVMLLGTTFAWFTDSVTSSGNVIQSGNLDIDLMKGEKIGDDWSWTSTEGQAIFDYDNWEPGYTSVAVLAVQNKGNLSAKWTAKLTVNGEPSILADVVDIYATSYHNYSETRPNFEDGTWQKLGSVADLIANGGNLPIPGGLIQPNHRQPILIAVHMREDAGNEYQNLSLGANFDITILATQATYESDSFDDQYDANAEWPTTAGGASASALIDSTNLTLGALNNEVTITGNGFSATVPADVKIANGATSLDLTVKSADADGNISYGDGESAVGFDVHINGIAADNTVPMIVNLGAILPVGLSNTELKLYHTENGAPVEMTRVNSADEFSLHNQYTYNDATGEVSIYVASFSIFSAVQTSADVWDGTVDTSWYNENDTEFTLTTAAQFAGFRVIVDGGYYDAEWNWNEETQDSFLGKTVTLGADIDLDNRPFDPIGFTYVHKDGKAFMGTFDGGKHTIYNLYQNCWELDPDKTNYSTYTYSTAGAGLFASIKDATIKNLVMSDAEIVFECVDSGVVVGYAQGNCHFENIVVTNSNIANHNRYTGGVVGEVCFGSYGTDVSKGYSHTFKNIVVDSTVTVSGLWGSFGGGMGGVIGGKWGDATVKMENVISAPKLDVFNDVVSAYQWYAFRGCGMIIGYTEEPVSDGKHSGTATASFLTCDNVNVYYGDWTTQHYYEFANQDSDTGKRYPWVRAEEGNYADSFTNIRYGIPTHNGVVVTADNADEYKTNYAVIEFDQLYGGDQGIYGYSKHDGVTVTRLGETKTIYFQNNWNWTNLKIYYWYETGGVRWTTSPEGVSLTGKADTQVGGYDLYTFKIPSYVAGYKIEGFDSTKNETNSTHEASAEDIVDGNIYWFVYANGEYSMASSTLNNDNTFETHDIYLVGEGINDWKASDKWRLTESANGKTWTGTFTIDNADEVKLYNAKVINDYAAYISQEGIANNANTSLAPGKYTFTYSVDNNTFTINMIERILYLDPSSDWEKDGARFAAYVWYYSGSTKNEKWYSMTKQSDGTYKVSIDSKYVNVIFCRMNGGNSTNNWDNKWNQTGDLKASDGSLFTIKNGTWDGQTSGWSTK